MAKTPVKKTDAEIAAAKVEKTAKFKELGRKRVNAAIDKITILSNLSNRQSYEYTQEDADKIVKALNAAVKHVSDQFEAALAGKKAARTGFDF